MVPGARAIAMAGVECSTAERHGILVSLSAGRRVGRGECWWLFTTGFRMFRAGRGEA